MIATRTRRRLAAAASVAALALLPALAAACPVCGAGAEDRSNLAFLISTIFLSLMPLAAIGAGLLWLRHRSQEMRARESFAAETVEPAPGL